MGFFDSFTSLFVSDAYAEEPPEQDQEENKEGEEDSGDVKAQGDSEEGEGEEKSEEGGEEGGEQEEGDEESKDEGGDDEEEEEEDEEEEEEDEPEDPMPKLQEDCSKTAECSPLKHEYEECVARVTAAQEDENHKGPHEDCVEEFFEYTHCISQCAAPKLFKMLK